MSFPLILLPKRFAYVEDDQDFLELLRMTLSRKHSRMFFEAPQEALATLRQEVNYWDWLTRILSQSHRSRAEGKGEAALYVSSYFNDWRRFNLASVLAIDNGMPGMDGVILFLMRIVALLPPGKHCAGGAVRGSRFPRPCGDGSLDGAKAHHVLTALPNTPVSGRGRGISMLVRAQ